MGYNNWVQENLEALGKYLGFRYTPYYEIKDRIQRLKKSMEKSGIEAVIILQKMDCYYFSGTAQDAIMLIPVDTRPMLLVRRELERARVESPLEGVEGVKSFRNLPSFVYDYLGRLPKTIGLEMDMLSARDYFRYKSLFPDARFMDISKAIREIRKIKSSFEIELMRVAGDIGKKTYKKGREILKEGMTEIEFGGLLEAEAKVHGHEGLIRVRSINYEAYTWHVLSGWSGGVVSQSDSPMGGMGLSPAFPVGASLKPMKEHEPILVDFGTCYQGYQADETRMFSIGKMSGKFVKAYEVCKEIHDMVLGEARPGADCDAIFQKSLQMAKKMGYSDSYLGPPGLQTNFVGHGIGLELNEFPYIAVGHSYPLEEGMTFAVEPKIVFPGEGSVGIENTIAVTSDGYEVLTTLDQEIFQV